LFKFKICSKFEICSNFKKTFGICLKIELFSKFKIVQILEKRNVKKEKPGGIPYWTGPCTELHGCALLMRANRRAIGAPGGYWICGHRVPCHTLIGAFVACNSSYLKS
jgi:hypothetical protein